MDNETFSIKPTLKVFIVTATTIASLFSFSNNGMEKIQAAENDIIKPAAMTYSNTIEATESEYIKTTTQNGVDRPKITKKMTEILEQQTPMAESVEQIDVPIDITDEEPEENNIQNKSYTSVKLKMKILQMQGDLNNTMSINAFVIPILKNIGETSDNCPFTITEIEQMACIVQAEAGNQTELGKRLIIDCLLNQYESGDYGSTMTDVMFYPNNYSVITSGSYKTVNPPIEIYQYIDEELNNRNNYEVMYFRNEHYHNFGEPLFQEDDHFFSGKKK